MTNQQKDLHMRMTLTKAHRDFEKLLRARAMFKIGDIATSDDLVQMTFLKTWTYLVKGGKIDTMKAFLYHVLNGLIIDEYRKSKPTSLDILLEKGFDPYFNESDRLTNKIDGRKAVALIDRLPKKYQRVMRMKYVQDFSLSEMSSVSGQSKNTVAVQAYRGLVELKSLYFSPGTSGLKKTSKQVHA